MKAESPFLLEVAPDLTFVLEGFPPAFRRCAERFFYRFVGRGLLASRPPLRIVRAAVPASPGGPSLVAGPVEVRRRGGDSFYETAGLRARCDGSLATVEIADPSADALETFVRMGLVAILFELAEARGWLGLHAAAVAVSGRGVLLPGPSGAGKTTITQNAHRAGLAVLSDDLVWLRETGDGFRLHAFPRGLASVDPPPEPTADDIGVTAVVCPGIVARPRSRLVELALPEVLEALFAESGVLSVAEAGERFRALVRLAGSVPGYRLEAGSEPDEAIALLASLGA